MIGINEPMRIQVLGDSLQPNKKIEKDGFA
jgi:hypothetical protein